MISNIHNNIEKIKLCIRCGHNKPLSKFKIDRTCKDGHRNLCRDCVAIDRKTQFQKNKDKVKKQRTQWETENREYRNAYRRYLRGNNPFFVPKGCATFSDLTTEELIERNHSSRKQHHEQHKEDDRVYRHEYQKTHRKENRLRTKHRESIDPQFKIGNRLRSRILSALKVQKARKGAKSEKLLGCSVSHFRQWIESQWLPGMNWNNYGAQKLNGPKMWHIDHIVPCSSFNLLEVTEQYKCFHYTNMRPLWAYDNMSKSDKIVIDYQI